MAKQQALLSNSSAAAVADLYRSYLSQPGSLDPDWAKFFDDLDDEARGVLAGINGAGSAQQGADGGLAAVSAIAAGPGAAAAEDIRAATLDSIRALMLIRAYRVRGHLEANLDPLKLRKIEPPPELDPK